MIPDRTKRAALIINAIGNQMFSIAKQEK